MPRSNVAAVLVPAGKTDEHEFLRYNLAFGEDVFYGQVWRLASHMLKSHMDAVEQSLLAISQIPANSGHNLHKGTPREAFIRKFLEDHLSERVAIGTGEIIDSQSLPNQPRNQIDIVIYKRDYPKLEFGGGVNGFLAKSVVATIEVKSLLDQAAMRKSVETAKTIKSLTRNIITSFSTGYQPPSILTYVVAYDGPASLNTVQGWLPAIHTQLGIAYPPMAPKHNARVHIASPSIDAVFLLGRGFLHFDNSPIGFVTDSMREANPDLHWVFADTPNGNLLLLFLLLTQAVSGLSGSWLNPIPYVANFSVANLRMSP
jgi:hypothetical protein